MAKKTVIGLDHGNGWVKAKIKGKMIVAPSAIAKKSETLADSFAGSSLKLKTYVSNKNENKEFVWGEDVTNFSAYSTYGAQDRYKNEHYRLLNEFVLAELLFGLDEAALKNVVVITGVPSAEKGTFLEEDVISSLKGTHVVTVDGEEITFKVTEVLIVAQPVGTLMSLYLDENGYEIDEDLASETVGIIDVGTGTTDLDVFNKLRRNAEDKASIPFGTHDIYRRVANKIKEVNPAAVVSTSSVEKQFKNDSYEISKRSKVDILEFKKESIDTVSEQIKTEIQQIWKTWDRLDRIVLTGGGASIVGPHIKSLIGDVTIVKDAQLANVTGYYNWGVRFLGVE